MQTQISDLDQILKTAHEMSATDVHICAGSPPMMRINSRLVVMENQARLMPTDIEDMLVLLLSEQQLKTLD